MIYKPATGWAGLPVGLGFVSSLYGIPLNCWGAATAISHDGAVVAGSATGTLTNGFQVSYAAYWMNGVESLVPTPPDDPTTTTMAKTVPSSLRSSRLVAEQSEKAVCRIGRECDGGADAQVIPRTAQGLATLQAEAVALPVQNDIGCRRADRERHR